MELLMLCGIPTCGKSTYIEKLKKLDYWSDAVVLSTDNYIEKIAQEHNTTYNEIFENCIDEATRQLEINFIEAKDKGKNIIWDQTNLSVKARRKKLSKVPSLYARGVIYFEISLEEALERNKHREGKFIPESILKRMYHQFEVPTINEGFDYVEKVESQAILQPSL
jgi:tRNA uridine 5-carbamoylmethylation protein Kti12